MKRKDPDNRISSGPFVKIHLSYIWTHISENKDMLLPALLKISMITLLSLFYML